MLFYEWKYDVSAAYKFYILTSHYCDTLKWEIMKIARQEWEQLNIEWSNNHYLNTFIYRHFTSATIST